MVPPRFSWIMAGIAFALVSLFHSFPARSEPPTRWAPGDRTTALPGLIPAPAQFQDLGRWQLMTLPITGYVEAVKFKPDGKSFAFGDGCYVRIHDTNSMRLAGVLVGHTSNIKSLDWSPDGQRLATASEDKTVRLWNADGVPGPVLQGHTETVTAVAWHPNQDLLASASLDGTIRLWRPDGTTQTVIDGHDSPVHALAWHPDGQQLAAGDGKQLIRIWNIDGSPGPVLEGHVGRITTVKYSPDGKWLATGSTGVSPDDASQNVQPVVRLWTPDGTPGPVLRGYSRQINSIAFRPDSQQLVTASEDRQTLIHNIDGTKAGAMEEPQGKSSLCFAVDWHPVHNYIVVGGRFVVRYLSPNGQIGPSKLIRPFGSQLMFADWNPQDPKIAIAGTDGTIDIWSSDFEVRQTIEALATTVFCARWSPDGNRLASLGFRSLKIWNAQGELIREFTTDGSISRALSWTADGHFLAAATQGSGFAYIVDETKKVQWIKDHDGQILSVSFNPDGNKLVTSGTDGDLHIHELTDDRTGEAVGTVFHAPDGDVDAVEFSPDGKWIASGHTTSARLWRPDGTVGPVIPGFLASVMRIDWRPDGRAFATASWDSTVKIWKIDGSLLKELPRHAAPCWGVSFSRDGKQLVSCGWDGIVRVMDADTGDVQAIAIYVVGTEFNDDDDRRSQAPMSFSAAGEMLVGDTNVLEARFVYIVEQPSGAMEILRPSEFLTMAKNALDAPAEKAE